MVRSYSGVILKARNSRQELETKITRELQKHREFLNRLLDGKYVGFPNSSRELLDQHFNYHGLSVSIQEHILVSSAQRLKTCLGHVSPSERSMRAWSCVDIVAPVCVYKIIFDNTGELIVTAADDG
jgi:hypothetical protein